MTTASSSTFDSPRVPAPARSVIAVAWLMAAWCLGFAVANVVVGTAFDFGPSGYAAYANGLLVLNWFAFGLKVLGAGVALLSVANRTGPVPPRVLGVLTWGATALLGLYSLGSVVEAVGMLAGVYGSVEDITVRSVGYVLFFLAGALGYGVLARSCSRRYGVGRRAVLLGVLGAPVVLGLILLAIPLLLTAVGVMPGW